MRTCRVRSSQRLAIPVKCDADISSLGRNDAVCDQRESRDVRRTDAISDLDDLVSPGARLMGTTKEQMCPALAHQRLHLDGPITDRARGSDPLLESVQRELRLAKEDRPAQGVLSHRHTQEIVEPFGHGDALLDVGARALGLG